jgi:acetyl esterase
VVLDAQSETLIEAMRSTGMLPLRDLGVEGCRNMTDQQGAAIRGPQVSGVEDTVAGGPDGVPIRLYRPTGPPGTLPLVLFFHGGGWVMGGIGSHDATCRHLADDVGCLVASVGYRLAPENPFPAAIDDAWAATCWLIDHAGEFGGDPRRVAVAGDSAGGNLAAVVARLARDQGRALSFQLLIYPVVDRRLDRPSMVENAEGYLLERADVEWFWALYDPDGMAATDGRATLTAAGALEGLAPALVITAEHDPLRDEGEEYGKRLRDAGVPVTVRRYPRVFHGFFGMRGILDAATAAAEEAASALRSVFADAPQR